MSGYNNFSYFNGPTPSNEWWPGKDTKKTSYEDERIAIINKQTLGNQWPKAVQYTEFLNPTMAQNAQNYTTNMLQSSDSRIAEPTLPRHEVIQGTVTQLFSNFGYINDNIIFSKSDVLGQMVSVGDKVAVDASFQPNNPTKYKGERVCKMDDSRFNNISNATFGKINSLSQSNPTRFDNPTTNRWDVKKTTQPAMSRIDVSMKSASDNNNEYQVSSSRQDIASKNSVDTTQSGTMRNTIANKTSLDPMYSSQFLNSRLDLNVSPTNKNDSQTSPRIDLTSRSKHDSPRSDRSLKNRSDHSKIDSNNIPTARMDTYSKISLDERIDRSKRSKERSNSHKRSAEKITSSSKDKYSINKTRNAENKARKVKAARSKNLRKAEILRQKAKSPIKFKISPKSAPKVAPSIKSVSETKVKSVPKNYESFSHRELDCAAVKNQFRSLSLPKEFFHISLKYQSSFPLNHPMKLGNKCHFKVMDKKVKSIDQVTDVQLRKEIDPKDADTTFVAKVMLLSTDDLAKFYKDTLTLAEEFEGENKVPITKAIKFLIGSVGENKEFAIGGAWSPSLDGADPETNPRVLINTAIRTCKAMTGIDLSNCSSWPKFLELHYYRPLQQKNESSGNKPSIDVSAADEPVEYLEPRMETVVYYIPDIWNCVPSADNWKETVGLYREQLTCILCPPPVSIRPVGSPSITNNSCPGVTKTTTEGSPDASAAGGELNTSVDCGEPDEEDWSLNDVGSDKAKNSDATMTEEERPTHFSKLVLVNMKIVEIKKELELRKMNSKGVMDQLKARLKAALDKEEVEEKTKEAPAAVELTASPKPIPKNNLTDEQKNELKKLYIFSDQPEIIVHQNRKTLGNQLKIRTMSLHSLLSYYDVKLQETTFELAVFAKQFLEMLRRDAVFNIYKSIVVADNADLAHRDDVSSAKKAKLMVTTSKRTVNRPLLFSCTLLDKDRTNKISLEELRLLIEGLGICLSTNQLSAILDKVKDSSKYLRYRQLTDKEMTDADIADMLTVVNTEDLDYIKELAMGNKALFDGEVIPMDISVSEDEVERLKNELDKCERCRQLIEVKVDEIRDEAKRNMTLVETQAKEILKLKEQTADYKTRYYCEQDRGSRYKTQYEKLLRQVKEIDTMTAALNKRVTDTVTKHEAKKEESKERSTSVTKSKKRTTKSGDKSKKTSDKGKSASVAVVVSTDVQQVDVSSAEGSSVDLSVIEQIVDDDAITATATTTVQDYNEMVQNTTADECAVTDSGTTVADTVMIDSQQTSTVDEFDLLKVSDYDMITIEEVDM